MEKKVKVTIEVTEKEMPIITAYCNALANGALDPAVDGDIRDWDEIRDICKNHTPELKSLLYLLTGETLKSVSQLFRDAELLSTKHESVATAARDAQKWAADVLGYSEGDFGGWRCESRVRRTRLH